MTLIEQITEIFQEVFDNPELVITEETNASHVEGWDSFAQINIIIAVEEKYNIEFTTKEIGNLTCVGDMLDLLRTKGV